MDPKCLFQKETVYVERFNFKSNSLRNYTGSSITTTFCRFGSKVQYKVALSNKCAIF